MGAGVVLLTKPVPRDNIHTLGLEDNQTLIRSLSPAALSRPPVKWGDREVGIETVVNKTAPFTSHTQVRWICAAEAITDRFGENMLPTEFPPTQRPIPRPEIRLWKRCGTPDH